MPTKGNSDYVYIYIYIYISICQAPQTLNVVWPYWVFFTLSRKPRRVFKSFLGAVARYTQIVGPWRAMATPFVSKVTRTNTHRCCYYLKKQSFLGVDSVIYCARKARDPARVVDGVELCRRDHQFLRKMMIMGCSDFFSGTASTFGRGKKFVWAPHVHHVGSLLCPGKQISTQAKKW